MVGRMRQSTIILNMSRRLTKTFNEFLKEIFTSLHDAIVAIA